MRKRLSKIDITWSPNFAYIIGLIATDGNLSSNGRHISFTTKDLQLAELYKSCLNLTNTIGKKARGGSKEIKKYYVVQFGDVNFYEYLLTIGLTPRKSRTLSKVNVPTELFADFMRGCIDGDGNISISDHPESKHKQLKVRLYSASPDFLVWIHKMIRELWNIEGGHIYTDPVKSVSTLSYAKADGGKILKIMYYSKDVACLKRKQALAESMGEW